MPQRASRRVGVTGSAPGSQAEPEVCREMAEGRTGEAGSLIPQGLEAGECHGHSRVLESTLCHRLGAGLGREGWALGDQSGYSDRGWGCESESGVNLILRQCVLESSVLLVSVSSRSMTCNLH